jgi:hypothetical protein
MEMIVKNPGKKFGKRRVSHIIILDIPTPIFSRKPISSSMANQQTSAK